MGFERADLRSGILCRLIESLYQRNRIWRGNKPNRIVSMVQTAPTILQSRYQTWIRDGSDQRQSLERSREIMLTDQRPEIKPMSLNRKLWLAFSAAALLLLAYVGWIFYSRWHENSAINEQVKTEEQQEEQKRAADTVETLGGTEFKIISFYA